MVTVSLAVRLDDITTSRPVYPNDRSLRVRPADGLNPPIAKNDGYFVFTNYRPETILVASNLYEGFSLNVPDTDFLRIAMLPKTPPQGRLVEVEAAGGVYVGFKTDNGGYPLKAAAKAGSAEISVYKDDFNDLQGLLCLLTAPGGATGHIFINGGGNGKYSVAKPLERAFPVRSRLLPLQYVVGGRVRIPAPKDEQSVYIFNEGDGGKWL